MMKQMGSINRFARSFVVMLLVASLWTAAAQAAPTLANITGEIEQITLDTPGDHWSSG